MSERGRAAWFFEEMKSFAALSFYLFVAFATILYFKFALLEQEGVSFAPFGFAAVKALIAAKFLMIGIAVERRMTRKKQPLIIPTLYRSVAMLALLIMLIAIEEIVVGLFHGKPVLQSIMELGGGSRHEKLATVAIQLLILLPLFAFRSLADVVGYETLFRAYFERRRAK